MTTPNGRRSRHGLSARAALFLLLLPLLALATPALAGGGKKKGDAAPPAESGDGDGEETPAKPKKATKYKVGEVVENLDLELADGGTWSPSKGKGTVLVFAVDWSKEAVDGLVALGDPEGPLAKAGVERVGVLRDVKADKARKFAETKELKIALCIDPKRKAYDRFAARGVPFTVVIGKDGKLLSAKAGFDADDCVKALKGPAK